MSKLLDLKDELTGLYTEHVESIHSEVSENINKHRVKALEDFTQLGLPTKQHEDYRYTNLENYLMGEYTYELAPANFNVDLVDLFSCDVPNLNTHIVLVLNGFFNTTNFVEQLPKGVIVDSLASASLKYPEIVNKHYAQYADTSLDSLAALNTLFAQDGIFIHIPKNVVIEKPIQIINVGFSFKNLRITRRNLIVAEENAQANILVCDHTLCDKSFITNSLTEIYTGKNAVVDYNRMQNENSKSSQISNTFIYQEADSRFTSNTISLHGGLIRNNVFAKLDGINAENNTYGLFLCDDNQHVATFTHVNHAKPNCRSDQLIKGVLDDTSTGAFNGKIYVEKNASKTEAFQRNNNILLSDKAKMNTKPQLEIYNDDVKCSHGATIGQLDTEAMFYLQSRGIGLKEARHLLMYAFANEVVGKITLDPLKERTIDLVDKRLRGELTVCNNCNAGCSEN